MHTEQETSQPLENGVDKNVVVLEIDDSEAIESSRVAELHQLEADIRRADEAAERDKIRPRWKFGKRLVDLRNGKKILQPGVLKEHADREKVHRSELSARMKFADKFPTEEQLSTAVETYKTWTAIRQKPLTNRKRKADGNSAATPPTDDLAIPSRDRCTGQLRRILEQLRRIRTSLEDMRGAELGKDDLACLRGIFNSEIQQIIAAAKELSEANLQGRAA